MSNPKHGPFCETVNCHKTKCKFCRKTVLYWECSCGSKVFLDIQNAFLRSLPKHDCRAGNVAPSQSTSKQSGHKLEVTSGTIIVTGVVKWFDKQLGSGHIIIDGDGGHICVYRASLKIPGRNYLHAREKVEFEISTEGFLRIATNVRLKGKKSASLTESPVLDQASQQRKVIVRQAPPEPTEGELQRREQRRIEQKQWEEEFRRRQREDPQKQLEPWI